MVDLLVVVRNLLQRSSTEKENCRKFTEAWLDMVPTCQKLKELDLMNPHQLNSLQKVLKDIFHMLVHWTESSINSYKALNQEWATTGPTRSKNYKKMQSSSEWLHQDFKNQEFIQSINSDFKCMWLLYSIKPQLCVHFQRYYCWYCWNIKHYLVFMMIIEDRLQWYI